MFSLFRNKEKQKRAFDNDARDSIAKIIVVNCISLQQRWAAYMQRHSERLPGKWKFIMLSFFCLSAGGCSLLLIAGSLLTNRAVSFPVTQVKRSLHIAQSGDEKTKAITIVTKEEYEKIHRFRHYMDSLSKNPAGEKCHDNILIDRPGLMDSVILIENIYQSQTKK
jgi:hypothetical protein